MDWKRGDYPTFHYAYYHNWHKDIKRIMDWPFNYSREYEDSKAEAERFTSLAVWAKGAPSTYAYAYRRGWHRRIAKDLNWPCYKKTHEGRWEGDPPQKPNKS